MKWMILGTTGRPSFMVKENTDSKHHNTDNHEEQKNAHRYEEQPRKVMD
jgi:hypothetical protein